MKIKYIFFRETSPTLKKTDKIINQREI